MDANTLSSVAQLSDDELLAQIRDLAKREREATASVIAHLAELDGRRLYLAEGCSSLFTYCTQVLHFSEHAAYGRIEAARAARRFPVLLDMLEDGSLNLTTVGLLAAHLTGENHQELLDTARHQSKRQVEELVARLRPQPPVPGSVRRLPAARHTAVSSTALHDAAAELQPTGDAQGVAGQVLPSRQPIAPSRGCPAVIAPLTPQRYKVQFTASADAVAKLRLAQELLRHQILDGDPAVIFDRALTALLDVLAKQKLAATDRSRAQWLRGRAPFRSAPPGACEGGAGGLPDSCSSSRAGGRGWGSRRQLGPDRVQGRSFSQLSSILRESSPTTHWIRPTKAGDCGFVLSLGIPVFGSLWGGHFH